MGAETEHEDAELPLAEGAVAVSVALPEHGAEVVVGEGGEAEQRGVALETVEGDEAPGGVHEKAEAVAELLHEPLLAQLLRHQREVVLELHRLPARRHGKEFLVRYGIQEANDGEEKVKGGVVK